MRRRQRGIALITAVLVVALAAIAAAAVLTSANLAIHRTQNLQESELGWWYLDGVESWVRTILQRDAELNRYDSLKDIWATPAALPVDEGGLRGNIVDLQGRYNLNNLGVQGTSDAYNKQVAIFVRLYQQATGGDEYQGKALANAIRDYIDADSEPTGTDGGEDADYLGLDPPRRVPNRPMQSVSELLAVKGMTAQVYAKLVDLVAALPRNGTSINVNTAPPQLLLALFPDAGTPLEQFIAGRSARPAERVEDLDNEYNFSTAKVDKSLIGTSSEFFELRAEAYIGSGRLALYSFLYRPKSGGVPLVYGRSTFTE
ncbi:type II secretion system minor pseudopilin GspK [Solimonas flava]|uniref:type II secretion system minor pseudopilin GspK n=1 Tax=Solimonas flava TaxID=415849 RepID=UPI00042496C2|nr:type II secretion system minor pseudopilin GspK [Solimonas flava]